MARAVLSQLLMRDESALVAVALAATFCSSAALSQAEAETEVAPSQPVETVPTAPPAPFDRSSSSQLEGVKHQGRSATNSAASQTSDTGVALASNESEPQQTVESARFPLTKWCASCGGGSKRRVVRRQIRPAFAGRTNTRF